jgi:hypothetical protein
LECGRQRRLPPRCDFDALYSSIASLPHFSPMTTSNANIVSESYDRSVMKAGLSGTNAGHCKAIQEVQTT